MNQTPLFTIILAAFTICSALGETAYERELAKLNADVEVALATATEPVYRRYRAAAEQLLRKATQAGDLESANKVLEAIKAIPGTPKMGKALPQTAEELKAHLHGTVWGVSGDPAKTTAKGSDTITFDKNGTLTHMKDGKPMTRPVEFQGPRSVKQWGDQTEFNEDLTEFRTTNGTPYFGKRKR